ncbi:universal stress protein [uncultured Bacteroides sp.]|uniref:universal stress protein n=1 Tax=uncultured Bacteroides sp. TaxID=162156 RepID=UPI002AAA76E6|nr:universal stress protein [uncultured Bacteroides sp.]
MENIKSKKVLIAIDYDETSQKVAEQGFAMAKAMKAEIILLHVIFEQPIYYSSYTYMSELKVGVEDDFRERTQDFLAKTKKHLGDESIVTMLSEGKIAETILNTAEEKNVDIIVMGSHSRKWLENIIMGSDAEDVLKKTSIPLFIVPIKKQD